MKELKKLVEGYIYDQDGYNFIEIAFKIKDPKIRKIDNRKEKDLLKQQKKAKKKFTNKIYKKKYNVDGFEIIDSQEDDVDKDKKETFDFDKFDNRKGDEKENVDRKNGDKKIVDKEEDDSSDSSEEELEDKSNKSVDKS